MAPSPTISRLDGDAGGAGRPVFVGGAPRSGTHIVAHLIGAHPSYATIPYEVVVHCGWRQGIPAFVNGVIDRDELIDKLRTFWWQRPLPWRPELDRGLYKLLERDDLEEVLERFRAQPPDDRLAAGRRLADELFAAITAHSGAPGFAEHTPDNLMAAPDIDALFPDAKFIHVVRDGRDRACSVVSLPFGADTYAEAMRRWGLVLKGASGSSGDPARAVPRLRVSRTSCSPSASAPTHACSSSSSFPTTPRCAPSSNPRSARARPRGALAHRAQPGRARAARIAYAETVAELRAAGVSSLPPERSSEVAFGVSEGTSSVDPWVEGRGGEDI